MSDEIEAIGTFPIWKDYESTGGRDQIYDYYYYSNTSCHSGLRLMSVISMGHPLFLYKWVHDWVCSKTLKIF